MAIANRFKISSTNGTPGEVLTVDVSVPTSLTLSFQPYVYDTPEQGWEIQPTTIASIPFLVIKSLATIAAPAPIPNLLGFSIGSLQMVTNTSPDRIWNIIGFNNNTLGSDIVLINPISPATNPLVLQYNAAVPILAPFKLNEPDYVWHLTPYP